MSGKQGKYLYLPEEKWLASDNPTTLVPFLRKGIGASDRKLLLLAAAGLWELADSLPPVAEDLALRLEEAADGSAPWEGEMMEWGEPARPLDTLYAQLGPLAGWDPGSYGPTRDGTPRTARLSAFLLLAGMTFGDENESYSTLCEWGHESEIAQEAGPETWAAWQECTREYARLVREVIGNPYHPVAVDPGWLTWQEGTVAHMARRIYDTPDFAALPVLADALEEAGCREAALLEHLHSGEDHVRGCWALDLLLGKE